ncbi:TolB family protein [Draconibacterium orientale]|nr:SMP-30/gluconolactonase/LRE family protein [Draconibacterium orientale]
MAQNKTGIFDNHTDIGDCKHPGFASYNSNNQSYTIGGSGFNMWFADDQFHYLWTTLQGDFILRAEVKLLGDGVDPHRKVGWMVRNNLDSNSPHANATVHGDGLTSLQYRKTAGADTEEVTSEDQSPDVIQLERKGSTFIMSTAKFGEPFKVAQLENLSLDNEVYVGIYVCAHNADVMESAVYRNVRIIRPEKEDYVPYTDYIGSDLEILDIESGLRKKIHHSAHSIQAPNWTTDNEKLIYNSKGHLFTYKLANGEIKPLNTGFATNNNNDHVLTFDGSLLGISHHSADNDGNSTIYYLPAKGDSTPVKVTKTGLGASYFHGWSPDKKTMIFTGQRNGQFDIYGVNVATGEETQLTNEKTLDDGPEFSPDGKYIFFNSARSGKMQLWRMDADGKNPVQLTDDKYNDWFPHVSPDKKWIVFISFPEDIDPADHPFYKHCLIRLMPYEGGEPRIIAYIYGGQGSMNVPSWSPDSKKIAFVSNSD